MALHDALPGQAGVKVRVVGFAADGGGVEQKLGAAEGQEHLQKTAQRALHDDEKRSLSACVKWRLLGRCLHVYGQRTFMRLYLYSRRNTQRSYIYRYMELKDTVRRQVLRKINDAAGAPVRALKPPPGGWIASVRGALGMSGAELGRRLSLKRGRISQVEKAELEGRVTLRTMQRTAEALGCRFVYAIIPASGDLSDVIKAQAHVKAIEVVTRAATHMALEQQSLSDAQNTEKIERLTQVLAADPPPRFWDKS